MRSPLGERGARRFLVYPLLGPARPRIGDAIAWRLRRLPIACPVCGALTSAVDFSRDATMRESGRCKRCGATNRQRQVAYMTCQVLGRRVGRRLRCLVDVARLRGLVVYNTEAQGPVHQRLAAMDGYLASEYFGPEVESGRLVDGVMHQDLRDLSFPDESIDLVLSSDVLEHVPDPYRAHAEIFRVLRPGGSHLCTVPFHQHLHLDDHRATVDERGNVVLLKEPIYHGDPVRPSEGVLVYTIFSLEMLVRLRELGFETSLYLLYLPWRGIVGHNAVVFEAVKPVKADQPVP